MAKLVILDRPPGFIETRVNGTIADTVRDIVEQISDRETGPKIREAYSTVSNQLKKNKWSGQASADVVLRKSDLAALEDSLLVLCHAIGIGGRETYVIELGKDDLLAAVKIVLAYYRRMFWIADHLRTGKVQHLFSFDPGGANLQPEA